MLYTLSVSKTSLVEKHMERIHSLEAALRQRDSSLHKFNTQLHSKDMQYLQLHASPDTHSESFLVFSYELLYIVAIYLI